MPTYEYRCSSCKRTFEAHQSFSDAPLMTCEVCGGELKRVFHPVGIVLKGSGFYSTDNRSRKALSAKSESSSSSSDSSSGSSSDSSSSGSKSEKKSEKKSGNKGSSSESAAS